MKTSIYIENGSTQLVLTPEKQVIASGDTEAELVASAKHYKKLCGMSMEEYLRSLASPNDQGQLRREESHE